MKPRPPWPWERAKRDDRWPELMPWQETAARYFTTTMGERFGFAHVEDPLVRAIKAIRIPAPVVG